ncbi:unnamed protein product [Paramecium primaurelia]|uniref:Protein kinase domain-containing protein n=1 Tax=Paramecium primaurelia TaxID=5886 RepID=A0A8S1K2N0_PARPR|nr:unnamed protein product [Paramecium primaurelia]
MKSSNKYFLSNGQVIQGYYIESFIGKGQFGQVFKAVKLADQVQVAIKVIQKKRFSENDGILGQLVLSEIKALQLIKSNHVVGFVETFQDGEYCYIVMEYCNSGDLEQQLKNPNFKLTEQDAKGIMKQILKGLKDLHSKFIIHRDLKVQNIMVHNNSIYKIADLGFCKLLQNADQKSVLQLGTLFTMAPEIFNQNQYGLSSDMFSVGVIFYQILYSRYPFKQKDYLSNSQPNINFEKNKIEVSDQTKDLLKKMLSFDPKTRISFQDLTLHPAFEKPIFSQISNIQLQANLIKMDDHSNFYQKQSKIIEEKQQEILNQKQIEEKQQDILNQKQIEEKQQDILNQKQIEPINQMDSTLQKKIKIIEISEINSNYLENKLSLEIEKINKKINEMYFFSNTLQEVIYVLQQPHIMDILCIKIKQLCESILKMIKENMQQYKNQKQYQHDYDLLEEQNREMGSFYELIQYQLLDVKDQLKQFSEKSLAESISQHNDQEYLLNYRFSQLLNSQLNKDCKIINFAFSHVVLCYLFCKTKNPQFIQFDETTFDFNRSTEQFPDSVKLLVQLETNSSINFNQYY